MTQLTAHQASLKLEEVSLRLDYLHGDAIVIRRLLREVQEVLDLDSGNMIDLGALSAAEEQHASIH